MVTQRLRQAASEEQPLPILRICWDELFDFLGRVFKLKKVKAWTALGNLDAETATEYKKVFEEVVPDEFEGSLNEISLFSSRPDTTLWELVIVEEAQFTAKRIYANLTLPYGGLTIQTKQKVRLRAKTDGTATDIAGSLTGRLIFLGKK